MKRNLFVIALISCFVIATYAYAQSGTTAGVKYQYCEFTWSYTWNTYNGKTEKISGQIAYPNGQNQAGIESRINGLNQLGANGWELCTAYIEEGEGWQNAVYSFKKKL